MVKIGSVRWQGRCSRHSRYDPETDGLGGVKGGCARCQMLLDIWTAHTKLVRLMREFGSRDVPKKAKETAPDEGRQMSLLD